MKTQLKLSSELVELSRSRTKVYLYFTTRNLMNEIYKISSTKSDNFQI